MFKKYYYYNKIILVFNMIDIFDIIHYLIGLLIVGFCVWTMIQIHEYFSKDNMQLETLINNSNSTRVNL
jgi:hypothetical protein